MDWRLKQPTRRRRLRRRERWKRIARSAAESLRAVVDRSRWRYHHRDAADPPRHSMQRNRLAQYSQQGQFVAGKNFYQNNASMGGRGSAEIHRTRNGQRIQFNSPEYFAFAAKNRRALPWLSLGQKCSSFWTARFTRSTNKQPKPQASAYENKSRFTTSFALLDARRVRARRKRELKSTRRKAPKSRSCKSPSCWTPAAAWRA